MKRFFVTAFLVVAFNFWVLGESTSNASSHNVLLPHPQQIRYGAGKLPLRSLGIRFASSPSSEDRFAAGELASVLALRAGTSIPVWESIGPGKAIVLNRTGPTDPLPFPDERPGPDSREAYSVKASASGIEIQARSSAGIFYGAQTLCQLVEGYDEQAAIPEVEIQDWPSLAYRGTMVDMSHGALPTEEEIKRQIDFLASWKANQYYFYSEASIELEGYLLLNPRGRFTKDQVRRIIAYGRERHIDVIPCLELYGHLHDLFRVEKYADLAALPHGGEFNPRNPKVMELLSDWAEQFVRLFPSPFVHIGFDETWQIEMAAKVEGRDATPAKLFVQQLKNVAGLFQHHNKRVMAWGDIIVKYPEIFAELPPGLIAIAWEYDAADGYKKWLDPMINKGVPHIIATAVSFWRELVPDFEYTFDNIDTFLVAGRQSKTMGLINTVWLDSSQNFIRLAWPAMAYGAAAAWQSSPIDRALFFKDYAQHMAPASAATELAKGLEKFSEAELRLQKALGQQTIHAFWDDPLSVEILKKSAEHRDDLRQTRLLAEDAYEHFCEALQLKGDANILSGLLLGSRMLDYAGAKFLCAIELMDRWKQLGPKVNKESWWNAFESEWAYQSHSRLVDLMDWITELRRDYRSAWLAEYTEYRLDSTLGRWDAEYEYWRRLQARFRTFSKRLKDGDTLPPLEKVIRGEGF
jgi:hexosaminidase